MRSSFPARLGLAFGVLALAVSVASAAEVDRLGKQIADFTLKNQFGKEYSLQQLEDKDVVVVAFLGTECPLAKLYGPRLAELASKLEDQSVAFIGIDSNQQDSLEEIAAYARRHDINFPILKDPGNEIADRFEAERTPEVFVLDRDRIIRYCGRIDDQYGFAEGVGYQRPEPSRQDLLVAVEELLAGKPVSEPSTAPLGCIIGRVRPVDPTSEVTYSNQIARVFQEHCVECHRPGQIGPFTLTSYDDAVGWGEMILEVVDQGRMPPWHAAGDRDKFKNDLRLSEEDKDLIATWVANGCPEGDPSQLPSPREFTEGWTIGEPDQIIYMSDEPVDVPAEGVIDYYHFYVDPGWEEDKWIMAAEAKPSSPETVHHILVFVAPPNRFGDRGRSSRFSRRDRDDDDRGRSERGPSDGERRGEGGGISSGNLIAGYAPGMNPMLVTDGTTAMHVPAGSKLIFQLHYTPNGTPQSDRSYVGFRFADPEKVEYVARSTAVANPFFAIPAGAENHKATAESTFESDTLLWNMTPHMHTRGKSFRYEVTYPDGTEEVLLDVPTYDFNWQTTYFLNEPKMIPKGSKLVCTAHWDNSESNLSNPDPTETVTWGDQTWEEMMIGFYVEVFPKGEVPAPGSRRMFGQAKPEQIFRSLDANEDGILTKDEMPDRLGERLGLADINGDGGVSLEELQAILKLFSRRSDND